MLGAVPLSDTPRRAVTVVLLWPPVTSPLRFPVKPLAVVALSALPACVALATAPVILLPAREVIQAGSA